jgi:hypothetical protein
LEERRDVVQVDFRAKHWTRVCDLELEPLLGL